MIELQQHIEIPSDSITVDGLYELLQPYYGRVVRASTVNPSTGERIRQLGGLQGLTLEESVYDEHGRRIPARLQKLFLILEGRGAMLLIRRTSSVEVLQDDSGRWVQIYLGSDSPEAKKVTAA